VILSFKALKDVVECDFVVLKDTDKGLCKKTPDHAPLKHGHAKLGRKKQGG
jgi:hypothetical protein